MWVAWANVMYLFEIDHLYEGFSSAAAIRGFRTCSARCFPDVIHNGNFGRCFFCCWWYLRLTPTFLPSFHMFNAWSNDQHGYCNDHSKAHNGDADKENELWSCNPGFALYIFLGISNFILFPSLFILSHCMKIIESILPLILEVDGERSEAWFWRRGGGSMLFPSPSPPHLNQMTQATAQVDKTIRNKIPMKKTGCVWIPRSE